MIHPSLCPAAVSPRRCPLAHCAVSATQGYGTDKVDYIWYDQEHSTMSPESLQSHIIAAHGRGIAVIVRIQGPNNGYQSAGPTQPWGTWIKAALDAGADGVIVPQVRTAEEVRTIVGTCSPALRLSTPAADRS